MTDKLKLAIEEARRQADAYTSVESPSGQDHLAAIVGLLDDALDLCAFIEAGENNYSARDRAFDAAQARHDAYRGIF